MSWKNLNFAEEKINELCYYEFIIAKSFFCELFHKLLLNDKMKKKTRISPKVDKNVTSFVDLQHIKI